MGPRRPRRAALALLAALPWAVGSFAAGALRAGAEERPRFEVRDATAALPMRCEGRFAQGGMAVCLAEPDARITIGEAETRADETGEFVLGFDRDAPAEESIRLVVPDGRVFTGRLPITPRRFDVSRIDGLPPSQVDQFTKEQLARIEASTARKERGDRSRAALHAFRDRFARPLAARRTSPFGAQRILNGVPARPHYGVDLAAPVGTPIVAPADGVVALADSDLYFEGAMIVLDHGQGFLSKYLHVSRIDVEAGSRVRRGQTIGAVGSRGRSTGPHLCWRLKWRDRNLDPELWLADGAGAVAEKEPR